LADGFVNHREAGAVKIDNTQDEPVVLSSSGVPFADYSLSRRRNWACVPSPAPKRMTRPFAPRGRTLLSSWSRGQCRLTLWGKPWTPGAEPTCPRPGPFRRSAAMYPGLARRYCAAPLAVPPLDSAPKRRRPSAGGFKRSELLPSRTPCGLHKPCTKDTPVRGGSCLRDVANVGVGAFRRRGTAGFRRAACAHPGARPLGPVDSGSPTRSRRRCMGR